MENDWPEQNEGSKPDLDLGDGHSLTWTRYEGEICGGIIRHDMPVSEKFPHGYCDGAFWLRGNKLTASEPNRPRWDLTGSFECPTLSPSFLCHCGDHGWIREGRWVRA
ncbi:MAG: DUF6527 family protein [Blastocatellia bacterium]